MVKQRGLTRKSTEPCWRSTADLRKWRHSENEAAAGAVWAGGGGTSGAGEVHGAERAARDGADGGEYGEGLGERGQKERFLTALGVTDGRSRAEQGAAVLRPTNLARKKGVRLVG